MQSYHVPQDERTDLERFRQSQPRPEMPIEDADVNTHCNWFAAHSALSHAVGVLFGRWYCECPSPTANAVDAEVCFDELPRNPPAMYSSGPFVGEQGQNVNGPDEVAVDGILVDDEAHRSDVVARVQHVFERFGKGDDTRCDKSTIQKYSACRYSHKRRRPRTFAPRPQAWAKDTTWGRHVVRGNLK